VTPRQQRVMKAIPVFGAITAITAVIAALLFFVHSANSNRTSGAPAHHATYSASDVKRYEYETAVHTLSGVAADFALFIDDTSGKAYTAYHDVTCDGRPCATSAKLADGSFAVTLPVAFSYSAGSQGFDKPEMGRVSSLTFWNAKTHQAETITATSGETVKLPEVLYRRNVEVVAVGESVYTSPDYIRVGAGGSSFVLPKIPVWYEDGGSFYGTIELARITRGSDGGFYICLPDGYTQLGDTIVGGMPAKILPSGCER
jgi:hypothetical protein